MFVFVTQVHILSHNDGVFLLLVVDGRIRHCQPSGFVNPYLPCLSRHVTHIRT